MKRRERARNHDTKMTLVRYSSKYKNSLFMGFERKNGKNSLQFA